MTTLGVEEEYLLVDPVSGLPVPAAERVRAEVSLRPGFDFNDVQPELLKAQLEVATPVCSSLDEIGGHLYRMRHELSAAAERVGCRMVACGTAPAGDGKPMEISEHPRYLAIAENARRLADVQLIHGMHVHVAVPDRETGVQIVNRIRPWLPALVALGANSPLWQGVDTGFASWRTIHYARWPVEGQPPVFIDLEEYERRVDALLGLGVMLDRGQVYWQVRLSERFPTIEIRCPDVQSRADDAVMLAGLVRALVVTALQQHGDKAPYATPDAELLRAACWLAARDGLDGDLFGPVGPAGTARRVDAGDLVREMLAHVAPVLDEFGDTTRVFALVERMIRQGTGADRQRAAFVAGGLPSVMDLLISDTSAR
ncbi:carboxylate-amine ligase [Embleya scabrispora]|uniref:carboxylate-amine ligase n=1 Tax=Embleya scabrispora TaxID=159449 RepID=UPI0003739AAE|nr:glutamate--cysteine ligase [Embleya scabrispora]MYS86400.1 YbdK family carboxylate-amine ligase [Streptomyces sp. SID5474]